MMILPQTLQGDLNESPATGWIYSFCFKEKQTYTLWNLGGWPLAKLSFKFSPTRDFWVENVCWLAQPRSPLKCN